AARAHFHRCIARATDLRRRIIGEEQQQNVSGITKLHSVDRESAAARSYASVREDREPMIPNPIKTQAPVDFPPNGLIPSGSACASAVPRHQRLAARIVVIRCVNLRARSRNARIATSFFPPS